MGNRPRKQPAREEQEHMARSNPKITDFAAADLHIPSIRRDWTLHATVAPGIFDTLTDPIVVTVCEYVKGKWTPDDKFSDGEILAHDTPTTLDVYVKIKAGAYGERRLGLTAYTVKGDKVTVTTKDGKYFAINDA